MSRAGAGVVSQHELETMYGGKLPSGFKAAVKSEASPVLSKKERWGQQAGRLLMLSRIRKAKGLTFADPRFAIPKRDAKRSRNVREARLRGDGPGMTNPHGYTEEQLDRYAESVRASA